MALQSSGQISLNDMHIEAGGSSGTYCTINDSDIRGLIGKSSGAQNRFNEFYGASSAISAIQFISARRVVTGSSSSVSAQWPSGVQAGDIIFATGHRQGVQWASGQWPPSGWTDLQLSTNTATNSGESANWQHNAWTVVTSAQTFGATAWTRTMASSATSNTTILWCFRPTGTVSNVSLTFNRGKYQTQGIYTVGSRGSGGVALSL